jgi:hypothetical protein
MTDRERFLGIILLGALGAAACLLGSRLYLERMRSLGAATAAAKAKVTRMEAELRDMRSAATRARARKSAASSPELFLSGFDRVVRSAGWTTESTVFKGRKDGCARFSISIEGPDSAWARLLEALGAWDERALIESVEGSSSRGGRMRADLEAGCAIE